MKNAKEAFCLLSLLLFSCNSPPSSHEKKVERQVDKPPIVEYRAPLVLEQDVDKAIRDIEGSVAISIHSLADGWTIDRGCNLHLPQQSVSKLWVAMTLFDQVDQGKIGLHQAVILNRSDLTLFHQPIASLIGVNGYQTTVLDLLMRAMTQSDNTANDRLLTIIGGPDAVRDFLSKKDLKGIRFGPGERLLQSATAGLMWNQSLSMPWAFQNARNHIPSQDRLAAYRRYVLSPPDGATACGIAEGLAKLQSGDLLSPVSTQTLLAIMGASRTGWARLRSGLPKGWHLSHKTGTGQQYSGRTAGFNDVGILKSPEGEAYAVAVLIGDSGSSDRAKQQFIRSIGQAVVAQHTRKMSGF